MESTLGMTEGMRQLNRDFKLRASDRQLASDLGDEVVILDLDRSSYVGLDGVGARIWKLLEDGATIADLLETIVEEYEVSEEQFAADLPQILDELMARGLVQIDGD